MIKEERKRIKNKLLRKSPYCFFCEIELDKATATLDHIIPIHVGGSDDETNANLACHRCNAKKGNKIHLRQILKKLGIEIEFTEQQRQLMKLMGLYDYKAKSV